MKNVQIIGLALGMAMMSWGVGAKSLRKTLRRRKSRRLPRWTT